MKRVTTLWIQIIAILIGTGLSGFINHSRQLAPPAEEWFIYKGELFNKSQAGSYIYTNGKDPMCADANVLCAIKVTSDGRGRILQSALTIFAGNPGFARPVPGRVEFRNNP